MLFTNDLGYPEIQRPLPKRGPLRTSRCWWHRAAQ